MGELKFIVHGPIVPWQRVAWVKGHAILPKQTRGYQGYIRTHATLAVMSAKGEWIPNESRAVRVTIVAYLPDRRRRDIDNISKQFLDGMNKSGVYVDDSQVGELHVFAEVDKEHPRVEVTVKLREEEA
jgi:Holliday junction resolvase RusA-like endonuclease